MYGNVRTWAEKPSAQDSVVQIAQLVTPNETS
jgi:hypothetical protein